MLTSIEAENFFYDTRHKKEEGVVEDWCDICEKVTKHTVISGHTGLDSYSYCICQVCGHKE